MNANIFRCARDVAKQVTPTCNDVPLAIWKGLVLVLDNSELFC